MKDGTGVGDRSNADELIYNAKWGHYILNFIPWHEAHSAAPAAPGSGHLVLQLGQQRLQLHIQWANLSHKQSENTLTILSSY